MTRFLKILTALLALGPVAFGYTNVLDNGTVQTVTNAWSIPGQSLIVGNATITNRLDIIAGGSVISSNGVIGNTASADANDVSVSGAGASWTMSDDLIVGNAGSGNYLVITNGGSVENANGIIGAQSGAAGNGVVVADTGSQWRNTGGSLQVGSASETSGSLLAVTNGAWVYVGEATSNDVAAVSGGGILVASTNGASLTANNGAVIFTTGTLYIGGITNTLTGSVTVTNSSSITVSDLQIEEGSELNLDSKGSLFVTGDYNADTQTNVNWNRGGEIVVGGQLTKTNGLTAADGSSLLLTISGGSWTNNSDLMVSGDANYLQIQDGGGVTNLNGYVIGTNNTVAVQLSGSHWQNNGSLNITNSGNIVYVGSGGRITADSLNVTDGNTFDLAANGTLEINGSFDVASQSNLDWQAGGNLSVAGTLTGMTAAELSGAQYAYLGSQRDLTLNGGSWIHAGNTNLVIGYNASNSDLVISNGTVRNADGYIGWGSSSALNQVSVTGASAEWRNEGGELYVGAYSNSTALVNTGGRNFLNVENGGKVFVGELAVMPAGTGLLVASTNGASLIVGNGSVTVEDTMQLGSGSALGTNIIRSGGSVSVGDLVIESGSFLDLRSGGRFGTGADFDVQDWSTNGFSWGEGAALSVGGNLTGMPTTNGGAAYLGGSRDLTLEGGTWNIPGTEVIVGLDASGSSLTLRNGGSMTSDTTYIGWGTNAGNSEVALNLGSTWVNSGDVWVGYGSSTNSLFIGGASTNTVGGTAFIGSSNSSLNAVQIEGSNTLWDVTQAVNVGGTNGGSFNTLSVYDAAKIMIGTDLNIFSSNGLDMATGGSIDLGGDLNVYSNSVLGGEGSIGIGGDLNFTGLGIDLSTSLIFTGSGSSVVDVNSGVFTVGNSTSNQFLSFGSLSMTDSTLEGTGLLDASTFGTVTLNGGTINPNNGTSLFGTLEIDGNLILNGGTLYTAQVSKVGQDLLKVNSSVDLSMLDLGVFIPNSAIDTNIVILEATGLTGSFNSTNLVDRLLLFDSTLVVDGAGTVSILTTANNTKFSSALTYAGSESIRAGFDGMKSAVFTRTKQLRRNLVSTAHAIPHEAFLLSNTNAPAGAMGPGDQNTILDMHVWMQYFNGQGSYNAQGNSYGFDLNNNGMTIGADRLIGEALTVGVNYTYARGDARTTNNDKLDTETYWLGAYGEWVGESGLYVDALAAVGKTAYDSVRLENAYRGLATYEGREVGAYADVGQYYHYKNLALSPYVGLHLLRVKADGFDEADEIGNAQTYVEESTRTWVESALGLKGRHRFDTRFGRFQTTGFAEWKHDFIQDDVSARMTANNYTVEMAGISPDPDVIGAGIGLSWINTDYLEIGVGYNGRFSENYEEHTGSLMLDVRF